MDLRKEYTPSECGVLSIHKTKTGSITTNAIFTGVWIEVYCSDIIREIRSDFNLISSAEDYNKFSSKYKKLLSDDYGGFYRSGYKGPHHEVVSKSEGATTTVKCETSPATESSGKEERIKLFQRCINFFNEFDTNCFSARVANTLAGKTRKEIDEYVKGYYSLIVTASLNDVIEKMKSAEWAELAKGLSELKTDKKINNRLEIYYGPFGTGKTTKIMSENPDILVIACNPEIDSKSIFREIDFEDGKPVKLWTELIECARKGKPTLLEEAAFLQKPVQVMCQILTDNKPYVFIEDTRIDIADGFKLIITMNVEVDGARRSLTTALVDRAAVIAEMPVTAEIINNYGGYDD